MLETFLERPSTLKRHREASLLKEREEFHLSLQQQRNKSCSSAKSFRRINPRGSSAEIKRSARSGPRGDPQSSEALCPPTTVKSKGSFRRPRRVLFFLWGRKKWLRFLDRLKPPGVRRARFAGGLRSIHGIGTGTVAALDPVKLLEGIEVPDMVRRATFGSCCGNEVVFWYDVPQRVLICLSQDDRLVKAALGCQNPAAADESRRLKNATELLPQKGTIVRDVVLSLPSALDFSCYIKMEGITTLIAPIPHLMNDASTPLV
jgi:hypothetical protein